MTTKPKSLDERIKEWNTPPKDKRNLCLLTPNFVDDLIADRERLKAENERLRKIVIAAGGIL